MKNYDPKAAAKVWDRVQNAAVPPGDSQLILNLIADEILDARTYALLTKRLSPPQAAIIRQISQQEQAHAACLKGIYTMITGRNAIVPPPKVADDPADIVLRRCYGREMRCLAAYEQRTGDREYGPVFARLAEQKKEHCRLVLELIGQMK